MPKGAKGLRHEGLGARHPGITRCRRQRLCGARCQRGFTLLELMIVISMILILMSDLFALRSVISQYTLDKAKAPMGLEDLKTAGYIREIPKDPMTNEANWEVVQEDVLLAVDQTEPGISDVKSASNLITSDGTAYSTW